MPNINVRLRLEDIANNLDKVVEHIVQYSGIQARDALAIENLSARIAERATRIFAASQEAQGHPSPDRIVRGVRKALGYTSP